MCGIAVKFNTTKIKLHQILTEQNDLYLGKENSDVPAPVMWLYRRIVRLTPLDGAGKSEVYYCQYQYAEER